MAIYVEIGYSSYLVIRSGAQKLQLTQVNELCLSQKILYIVVYQKINEVEI